MVSVSDFSLGPYHVALYEGKHSYRVKCSNYRSPVYAGSWNYTNFNDVTYTLLEGDFKSCIFQFFNEVSYLQKLYRDTYLTEGEMNYGVQLSLDS